jgi:hypothetical protein
VKNRQHGAARFALAQPVDAASTLTIIAVWLGNLVSACGNGSGGQETVRCTTLDSVLETCYCGTDVAANDRLIEHCDTTTPVTLAPVACCALQNSRYSSCLCEAYYCSYVDNIGAPVPAVGARKASIQPTPVPGRFVARNRRPPHSRAEDATAEIPLARALTFEWLNVDSAIRRTYADPTDTRCQSADSIGVVCATTCSRFLDELTAFYPRRPLVFITDNISTRTGEEGSTRPRPRLSSPWR